MTALLSAERRDEIDSVVRDARAGTIFVTDVRVEEREDADERYVLVAVTLSQPTGETWPPEDFYEIRRQVREAVSGRLGPGVELQLTFSDAGAGDDEVEGPSASGAQA